MTLNYNTRHIPLVANWIKNWMDDGLDKELLNLKDVIIKDLQVENQRLRMKVNNLENKVMSLEMNGNHLEQYGRRNNLEITGIPDDISDENLEEKVIQVLSEIQVNVSSSDVEACHRIGKSKNSSKKKNNCMIY